MLIKKSFLSLILALLFIFILASSSLQADSILLDSTMPDLSDEITISSLNNEDLMPAVAYNWKHKEFLVVWHTKWVMGTRDIRGARVSESGQVLAEFIIYEHATKDSAQPGVAYDEVNDRYLVVFIFDTPGNGSNWDVYGRFIPWDGPSNAYTPFVICDWATHQWNPKVVYGRTMEEFLVGWTNEDQTAAVKAYIGLKRVRASDGHLVTGLSLFDLSENKVNVDIAYNLARNEYLVVYDNGLDIKATRFTGNLIPLSGGEFTIAGWPSTEIRPAVAACKNYDQYLVAWQSDQTPGPVNDAIYARFINGDGVLGTVHKIEDFTWREQKPDVSCNLWGSKYLVAWQQEASNGKFGIRSRIVHPDGTLDDAFVFVHPLDDNMDRTSVALAGGVTAFLAAWEHKRDSFQDIHGRLIIIFKSPTPTDPPPTDTPTMEPPITDTPTTDPPPTDTPTPTWDSLTPTPTSDPLTPSPPPTEAPPTEPPPQPASHRIFLPLIIR